jgi:hypothetical protein
MNMTDSVDALFDDLSNPLDGAEDFLVSANFSFNRMNRDELFVETRGQYGQYRIMFLWDEESGALQMCCETGLVMQEENLSQICRTLAEVNTSLWIGHFDLSPETMTPCFRHTQLFRGMTGTSGADHLQDLMQIALTECDRHYPAFLLLAEDDHCGPEQLSLAIMMPAGQS